VSIALSMGSISKSDLNDGRDKEATNSNTSQGRPRPIVAHRHRDVREQTQ